MIFVPQSERYSNVVISAVTDLNLIFKPFPKSKSSTYLSPCLHFVAQSMKQTDSVSDAYTPGTFSLPHPIPHAVIPA